MSRVAIANGKRQAVRKAVTSHRHARTVIGASSVMLFLALWQIIGSHNIVRSDLISYPGEISLTLIRLAASGELGTNLMVTLEEFIEGFLPAMVAGIVAGIAMALSRRLRYLVDPLFTALYSGPMIAFIPIIVVWFGVGMQSKVAIVFLSAVIPVIINTMAGVAEVSESWTRALRAFGATRRQVVVKAMLPGALPAIMAGLRLAVGRSIVSLIAAEMYVSISGLGRMIQVYSTSDRAAEVFVVVVVVSTFGLACVTALRAFEERLAPWRADQ